MDLDANMNEPEAGSKQRRPWNREEVTVQSHSGHVHTAARGFHRDPQQPAEASIQTSVALRSSWRPEPDSLRQDISSAQFPSDFQMIT